MDGRAVLGMVLLLGLAAGAAAGAGDVVVYRCESAAGVPVYSDRPCGDATRLVLDGSGPVGPGVGPVSPGAADDDPPGPTPGTCPAPTAGDLPAAVTAAFASRDANHLAGLYDWTGMGSAAAAPLFQHFNALLSQPLRSVSVGSGAPELAGGLLLLEVGPAQAPQQVQFRIVENAGCAWLRSI